MEPWLQSLLNLFALPEYGLATVFVVCLISATLLPVGSEFVVIGLVKLSPELFWPAILVATAGNTVGGAISWWTGYGAELLYERVQHKRASARALGWLQKLGPKACLLSWLPVVGDPLCALAGWLKLSFWPCVGYMSIGKFARYLTMTAGLLWAFPGKFTP